MVGYTLCVIAAEAAITPCCFSCSDKHNSLFRAPRSLNEAVNCKFSNFNHISAPKVLEMVSEKTKGVLQLNLPNALRQHEHHLMLESHFNLLLYHLSSQPQYTTNQLFFKTATIFHIDP